MSFKSDIEWTESTWNPSTGCTKISPGCSNCYAERFAERFRGVKDHPYEQGFDVKTWESRLKLPYQWKKPKVIFVNSMSDLFHPKIEDDFIYKVFQVMNDANWHKFQLLTKRPKRMLEISKHLNWPENVWAGVSVESQKWTWRIECLKEIQAKVRFLSCEPLLGALKLNLKDIHWVIVGGESGYGARTMQPEWVIDIQQQCSDYSVPFFFKQWGGVRKKKTGRILSGRTWDAMPILK